MLPISSATRLEAAVNLLAFPKTYGRQTFLSERLGVSRRWLRDLQRRLNQALAPQPGGRRPAAARDEPVPPSGGCRAPCCDPQTRWRRIESVALRLAVSPCSLRDISDILELAFNEKMSRRWVSERIHAADRKAREVLESLNLRATVVPVGADEIFAGKKPILTVVEPESLALLDAVRWEHRRGEDWEAILKRYPKLKRVASDCGKGLLAGLQRLGLTHQPDVFHGLRELYASVTRLEGLAYQAIEREYDALQRLEHTRRRGDDLRAAAQPYRHAAAKAREAIRRYDLIVWLAREIPAAREVPEHATEDSLARATATIQTAVQRLEELGVPRLRRIRTYFEPGKVLSFLRWALDHPDQPVMRGSSCVEAVHRFIRSDQTIKKHLDQDYVDLMRWFYNTRPFSTGARKGRSPLQWLGIEIPYRCWLDPLIN